jgi:uncharacterized protein YwqG
MWRKLIKQIFDRPAQIAEPVEVTPEMPTYDFEEIKERLASLARPYIKVEATELDAKFSQDPLPRTASKFGGLPWLPHGERFPLDSEGQPTILLAQINFAEVSHQPPFPKDGLLQIFVRRGFDDYDSTCSIIYRTPSEFSGPSDDYTCTELDALDDYFFDRVHRLSFEAAVDRGSLADDEFEGAAVKLLADYSAYRKDDDELNDLLHDHFGGDGHKLGGYAGFTQSDPREVGTPAGFNFLQIDSKDGIMIGDAGILHVFLDPKTIRSACTMKGWYYWDCC